MNVPTFSKHCTDIGKTDIVLMTLTPKDNIKLLDQTAYTLLL